MDQTNISQVPHPQLNISVVVPVYYGGVNLHHCLSALARATPTRPKEIIIVADGYTDGSWLIAEEFGARVLKIHASEGPARARNLGAEAAKGEILFFVDADVVVPSDIIGRIEAAFSNEPELAAIIGSYDDEPSETNFLSQYKNLFHHYIHQTSRKEASTFWGACGAIRRDVFLAMGGFDKSYRQPTIEDIELGYRLTQAGYSIRLFKEMQVKHLKYWGIGSLLKSDFFDRALPWTKLILRHKGFINDLNLRLSSRISVMLIYGIFIAMAAALWWPKALALTIAFALTFITINLPVYRFFFLKRGFCFMVKAIPWHGLYYLYSGLAFTCGFVKFFFVGRDHKG